MATQATGPKSDASAHNHATKSPDYLKAFQKLGPQIYFYSPGANQTKDADTTATATVATVKPDLIIMCTWMGASSRHIAKYTNEYLARYPTVPTLLVRCSQFDIMLRPERFQLEDIKPAIIPIRSVLSSLNKIPPRVLMHVFSNGGCWSAGKLSTAYSRAAGGSTLPLTALVLDSCPSYPRMKLSHRALAMFLPKNFIVNFVGSMLIWLLLFVIRAMNPLGLMTNVVIKMRKVLNDPAQPFVKGAIPRVYICSKSDAVIPLEDVYSHAEEAKGVMKRTGINDQEARKRVLLEEFRDSRHVGHLMVDRDRYWKIVEKAWEEGLRVQNSKV